MKFLEAKALKALKMRRDAAANKMLSGPSEDKSSPAMAAASTPTQPHQPSTESPTDAPTESPRKEFDITPAAADLANELGVDLSRVTGSGAGGRITVADIRAASEASKA